MRKLRADEQGFTIIELMIATMVFSLVLLMCALAIVQVGRMYFKGITMSRTQGVSRIIADDIGQAVQFGVGGAGAFYTTGVGPTSNALCIGSIRYSYVLYKRARDDIKHVFWKDRMGPADTCTPQDLSLDQPTPNGEEMMGDHMRLTRLNFTNPGSGNLYSLDMSVSYGAPDLYTNSTDNTQPTYLNICKLEAGSEFCAVSGLNTNVVKRL